MKRRLSAVDDSIGVWCDDQARTIELRLGLNRLGVVSELHALDRALVTILVDRLQRDPTSRDAIRDDLVRELWQAQQADLDRRGGLPF